MSYEEQREGEEEEADQYELNTVHNLNNNNNNSSRIDPDNNNTKTNSGFQGIVLRNLALPPSSVPQ